MDTQFTHNGRPVFVDNKCAYYINDYDQKVCINLIGGSRTKIKRVLVPTPTPVPPILNGTFTLSATGSVATLQSNGYLNTNPIPNTSSLGLPGNLRVKARFIDGPPSVGNIVRNGPAYGTVVSVSGSDAYIDTLVGAGWVSSNAAVFINLQNSASAPNNDIQILGWSLIVPTSQTITSINLLTTSGIITSTGTCSNTLVQGFTTIPSINNNFPPEPPVAFGNCIGVQVPGGTNGWKATVKQINFATLSSANNFELEFTKFGAGLAISTSWTINS